ncbi:MAG: protein translocase subunit SecF [Dehalococcoidia bacterium]|nr:protein translocase subunit SecF [Dehalococcoidia bacterium]
MNIVNRRKWFFLISALLVVPAIVALLTPPSLRAGIDFTGGTAMTVEFELPTSAPLIRLSLEELGHENAIVQSLDEKTYFIRLSELQQEERDSKDKIVVASGRSKIEQGLSSLSPMRITSIEAVSALIGSENIRNATIAVAVAAVAILLYVTWAFRRVPSPFRYGSAAIVALLHDLIIVLGIFSILGKFANLEVNAMFITGVLTVIGYSVNDTIVVFDRIRENVGKYQNIALPDIANISVRETIGRSLNTSITLLIVIAALLLFGGPTIQPLLLVLLVGVVVGTYSSIFVATLMLVSWEEGEIGRGFRRILPFGRRS